MFRKILIVGEDKTNRDFLRGILSDDYDAVEAADGKGAMEALHRGYK